MSREYIYYMLTLSIILSFKTASAEDYFNPLALELNELNTPINTDSFSQKGGQLPGTYWVDLYLNGNKIDNRQVAFTDKDGKLVPVLTIKTLGDLGVRTEAFPGLQQRKPDESLSDVSAYLPGFESQFDFSSQRLDLNIPQAALTSEARGYVDPARWDQGLPALMLNYSFSGSGNWQSGSKRQDFHFLNLRSGVNLGAWRARNYSTWNSTGKRSEWQHISSYLQRDIHALKGQLTLGDSGTPGEIFDSLQYRGVQLATDDNMFPDSLKGFAPVVRGIARSNAQVTVRQNGYIIYQTYVPAGPFAITDLYPTAASGELHVTITEADGTERNLVQAFSAVPVMLREGRLKYSVTAGEYQTTTPGAATPKFGLGTLIYGLPYDVTIYSGGLFAGNYQSVAVGVGYGLGDIGSISVDVTQARTRFEHTPEQSGQSLRFQYGKNIETTDTTFTLAGYRYSTSGFYDFREASESIGRDSNDLVRSYNKRSRMQLNVNQSLGDYGSLYFSAYQQSFWSNQRYERNISAGYNFSYSDISYGVNYTLNQTQDSHQKDQQFAFTVQVPLSKWLPDSWASYGMTSSRGGGSRQEVGLSGTALADNNLHYSLQQSYENRGAGASGSTNLEYRGRSGQVRGGYNYSSDSRQINYGLDGAIVAHPYGVTLSQPLGESMVLVRAPGAHHVNILNQTGVSTDARGYAVVPYASSYRQNRIALDSETLPGQIDITETVLNTVPTKGALALADFKTKSGSRALITLTRQNGVVPFGATATLVGTEKEDENSGIVGQNGQLYLSGLPDSGSMLVKWGNTPGQQCRVTFTLPHADPQSPVRELNARCL